MELSQEKEESKRSPSSTSTSASTATESSSLASGDLPQPFDTGLGNNFTSTCLPFFNGFLQNPTFQKCYPFSLLLQTSNAFFQDSKSLVSITEVLDATCEVDFDTCNNLLQDLGAQIKSSNNCGTDYSQSNPMVLMAYHGFVAYKPMFQAGCVKDSSGGYCFAEAITNTTSTADSYPYYLPLGVQLPGGARPTCDSCLSQTMSIFATAAANGSQPVSGLYDDAAQQINVGCGPDFVTATVTVTNLAAATLPRTWLVDMVFLAAVLAFSASLF